MNKVPNDRDDGVTTEHTVTFEVDPQLEVDLVSLPYGIALRLDADPCRIGKVMLAWLCTARRIALDEMNEQCE